MLDTLDYIAYLHILNMRNKVIYKENNTYRNYLCKKNSIDKILHLN